MSDNEKPLSPQISLFGDPSQRNYSNPAILPQVPTSTFKKSKWTPEEDRALIASVEKNGMSNWTMVASEVSGRTGKQCRERWTNQLCPELNKDNWTQQEDEILIKQQRIHGNFWSKISRFLPGRSSNAIKNRWSWLSRHGLTAMLAAQYNFPQQQFNPQRPRPPIPMIYQVQQTAPMEYRWVSQSPTNSNPFNVGVPFSEPNPTGNSFGSISSYHINDEDSEGIGSMTSNEMFFPHSDVIDDDLYDRQFWEGDQF